MSSDPAPAPPFTRAALLLEYDGTRYTGWQSQGPQPGGGIAMQDVLEAAIAKLTRGVRMPVTVAGRTDAGVHAEGQVASFMLPGNWRAGKIRDAVNFHLKPHPIVVLRAALAPDGWNPRFSAIGREYRFRILNRRSRPALLLNRVWHVEPQLDVDAMQAAADVLAGSHDFTSFRATACQAKSPLRTLDVLRVTRDGDIVQIEAAVRSFLHHQVRNLAGTLKLVGEGRWPVSRVAEALAARNRAAAGPTAPPEGLSLVAVRYPFDVFANSDARTDP